MPQRLVRESGLALLDAAMPEEDHRELAAVLGRFLVPDQVEAHGLRTRVAGRHTFAELHLLVPGDWSVRRGHDLCEDIEDAVHAEFTDLEMLIHLEPLEDPRSYADSPRAQYPLENLSAR